MQDEFGLNELDFGARFYDPAIARWAQLDPLAEGAADWTPYRYAFNNPMGYSDPSGMFEMPKGQFPDGFDNGYGLHLPWESGGGWSSSFGGVGSINGHYNYYCTNNAQEPVYDRGESSGYVYNEITKTYQKDGQDVSFSEVLASMSENGGATQGVMDYVWRSNTTGEIAAPGSNLENSYRSLEVVDTGIPVAKSGDGALQQFGDDMGQVMNAAGVMWGAAEMAGQYARQGNGTQAISKALEIGTQQTAKALNGTVKTLGAWGQKLGTAGMILSGASYGYQMINNPNDVSTATHANFWISAALYGAAAIIGGPIIGGAALIYGAAQLGSYMFTGNTVEENILGK